MSLLYLQERQEARSRELQTSQPHPNAREGHGGANNSRNHFQTYEGQGGGWESSVWVYSGQLMLDHPDRPLQLEEWLGGYGESSG